MTAACFIKIFQMEMSKELLEILSVVLSSRMQNHEQTDMKAAMSKMIDAKRDIFMYGSDKVFKAFNKWLLSTTNSNNKDQFAVFLDFVLEMRKDLCNNKTKLTKHDILLNLTQSEEEARRLFD